MEKIGHLLIRLLPSWLIRFLGQLQFKYPVAKKFIDWAQERFLPDEGFIREGVGKGLKFRVKGCNPGYLLGTSDPNEQRALSACLREGDVFYDIGANAGFYVVLAARIVGNSGRVCAFEPTPELADRIRYNARINEFDNVSVEEVAVSGTCGTVAFGASGFCVNNSFRKVGEFDTIKVETTTLDEWVPSHHPPDVIMMDIEGAELEALQGGLKTIRRYRPILLIEVHWLGEDFRSFVEEELLPLGYRAKTYDGSPLPPVGELTRYHAMFVPSEKADITGRT